MDLETGYTVMVFNYDVGVSAGAKIGHVAPCERRYMAV